MKAMKAVFRTAVTAGFVPRNRLQIKPRVRQMVCMIRETGQNPRQPVTVPATRGAKNEAISR
jgi:hypothetical protein